MDLKKDYKSILRHLKILEKDGYIKINKCPYGFAVAINTPVNDDIQNQDHINKGALTDAESKDIFNNKNEYTQEKLGIIITYLNENTGKNFRSTTRKTRDVVKARFNEGFSVEDFKKVIEIKALQWKDDAKMNRYLRPETLFGTKFESYLNEKILEDEMKENEGPEYTKI